MGGGLTAGPLGLNLGLLVGSNTVLELLNAAGSLNVLDTHVKALGDDAPPNTLVHHHTHSGLGDVPNAASLTVVETVRHTLVDGTVGNDVNVVTEPVGGKVYGHGGHAILPKPPLEEVASVAPYSPSPSAPHSAMRKNTVG